MQMICIKIFDGDNIIKIIYECDKPKGKRCCATCENAVNGRCPVQPLQGFMAGYAAAKSETLPGGNRLDT